MITFACPNCGKSLEADDALAGNPTRCGGCGTDTIVPLDVACDDLPGAPDARTITLEELEAMRRDMGRKPKA